MQKERPDLEPNLTRNEIQMPILNHKFKNFFFHPSKPFTLICLESNQYPDNIDTYHLASTDPGKRTEPIGASINKSRLMAPGVASMSIGNGSNNVSALGGELPPIGNKKGLNFKNALNSGLKNMGENFKQDPDDGTQHFIFNQLMKVEKRNNEEVRENNIAISFWDVSSRNPFQVSEARLTGKDTRFFKCSQDGRHIILVYTQAAEEPVEEAKEEEKAEEEKEDDQEAENLDEEEVNQEKKQANMVSVTHQRLAVFDINSLEKVSDSTIGDKDDITFDNIELIWGSTVVFGIKSSYFGLPATYFMPFERNEPLQTETSFRIHFSGEDEEKYDCLEEKNFFFNEAEPDKIYILVMYDKCFDMEDESDMEEEEQYELQLGYYFYNPDSDEDQSLNIVKTCEMGAIWDFSEEVISANKSFTKIFFLEAEKGEVSYVFDLETGELRKIDQVGAKPQLRKNSNLFEDFVVSSYDSENQRYFTIVEERVHQKSANLYVEEAQSDLLYDESTRMVYDACDIEKMGGKITIGHSKIGVEKTKSCGVREISNYSLKFPYLAFCKGNTEIFIKNLHYTHDQIVMPLGEDETFFSFFEVSSYPTERRVYDEEGEGSEEEKQMHMDEQDPDLDNLVQQLNNYDSVNIGYITQVSKGYKLNYLKSRPYQTRDNALFELFVGKKILKKKDLPQKEIVHAEMFQFDFPKGQKKVPADSLIIQYRDSIYIKSIIYDYSHEITKNLAPIRMAKAQSSEEFFYVTKEKVGSKIKIISYKEGTGDPDKTVHNEQSEIIAMVSKSNKVFSLDQTFKIKVFDILDEKDNKRSTLGFKCLLDCSPKTRENMLRNQEEICKPFLYCHLSNQNYLHIGDYFFRFFEKPTEMQLYSAEQQVYEISEKLEEDYQMKLVRGPFSVSEDVDSYLYIYDGQYNNDRQAVFRRSIDSKINFLTNISIDYASFIMPKKQGENYILVGIKKKYYLFQPNGQIVQEVKIDTVQPSEEGLDILDVSDNLEFFYFARQNHIHKLQQDEQGFFEFVQQQNMFSLTSEAPNPTHQQLMQQQEDEEEDEDGQQVDHNKIDVQTEGCKVIERSIQVGDDGSIWNLYWNFTEKKLYLRVDNEDKLSNDELPEFFIWQQLEEEGSDIQMVLLKRHLVFAAKHNYETQVYFVQVNQDGNQILGEFTKVNLVINQEWIFRQIQYVNGNDRVQIQLLNAEKSESITSIVTWDLKKNVEDRSLEVKGQPTITKGVNSNLNYIIQDGITYDLEFSFPLKFFADFKNWLVSHKFYEAGISENKDLLILKDYNKMGVSVTINEEQRRFLERFEEMKEQLARKPFPQTMIDFRTANGQNIFHFLIDDLRALKKFSQNYQKFIESFQEEEERQEYLERFLLILYPDNQLTSPFDFALNFSSQFVDQFLQMLTAVPDYQLSRFVFKDLRVFSQLLKMDLKSYYTFLDRCYFQTLSMQPIQIRYWKHGDDQDVKSGSSTSLLTRFYLRELVGRSLEDEEEKDIKEELDKSEDEDNEVDLRESQNNKSIRDITQLRKKRAKALDCKLKTKKTEDELEEKLEGQRKRIEVSMIEFTWIFTKKECFYFLEKLASAESDDIFGVETIKDSVMFLWDYYFGVVLRKVFLPYLIYFIVFFVYSSFVFDGENRAEGEQIPPANLILAGINIIYSIYALYKESRQCYSQGIQNYFFSSSALWNSIDLSSSILVVVFALFDLSGNNAQSARIVGSLAIFLLWVKFFYFLRIFEPTSAFIRMITQIIVDMGVFSGIYILANFAFANAWFVLNASYENNGEVESVAGEKWWQVIIYTYLTGLGEFGTDGFDGNEYQFLLWLYFIICTVLIQLVLLNTLIAIMGDTFDRVQESKDAAFLREICSLISENRMYLDHEETFRKFKYLTVANIEKAEGSGSGSWEGKLATLKTYFTSQIKALEESLKSQRAAQKEESQNMIKVMTQNMQINFKAQNQAQYAQDIEVKEIKNQLKDISQTLRNIQGN